MGGCQAKGIEPVVPDFRSKVALRKEIERLQREKASVQMQLHELRDARAQPHEAAQPALPKQHRQQQQQQQRTQGPSVEAERRGTDETTADGLPTLLTGVSAASTPNNFVDPMAESLNDLLDHMWPTISAYATRALQEEVEPELQAALPQALKGLQFSRERCDIGSRPPRFNKVSISKERQDTVGGTIQNIVLQCRLEWNADCNLCLEWGGVKAGIDSLTIRGLLLIELVGMISRPPLFEGFRMFFVNPPDVDLAFQGAGHGLLNMSLVKTKILDTISEGICSSLVVPNRVGMKLDPEADIFKIVSPPSEGILKVRVHSARKLPAMDVSFCAQATSDPYVRISCGAHEFRSPTVHKTLSPHFAYEVWFPISSPHQRVHMAIYDEDLVSQDDFLGKLSLPVSLMATWGTKEHTIKLKDEEGRAGSVGEVTISAQWRPLILNGGSSSQDMGDTIGSGVLFAGLHLASNVPDMGDGATYSVSMSCSGVLPGAESGPRETARKERAAAVQQAWEPQAKTAALRTKLAVLRKYGLSEEDMAGVLDVDPAKLRQALLLASETKAVDELASDESCQVEWEQGFEFLVEELQAAEVTFELFCQPAGSTTAKSLGKGTWRVAQYRRSPFVTVQIPGTSTSLHVRIRLLRLGEHTSRMASAAELEPCPTRL